MKSETANRARKRAANARGGEGKEKEVVGEG